MGSLGFEWLSFILVYCLDSHQPLSNREPFLVDGGGGGGGVTAYFYLLNFFFCVFYFCFLFFLILLCRGRFKKRKGANKVILELVDRILTEISTLLAKFTSVF